MRLLPVLLLTLPTCFFFRNRSDNGVEAFLADLQTAPRGEEAALVMSALLQGLQNSKLLQDGSYVAWISATLGLERPSQGLKARCPEPPRTPGGMWPASASLGAGARASSRPNTACGCGCSWGPSCRSPGRRLRRPGTTVESLLGAIRLTKCLHVVPRNHVGK